MQDAIRQAVKAYEADEVPVGAVIVRNDRVIARAWNQVEMLNDATAHAEMLALTAAEAAVGIGVSTIALCTSPRNPVQCAPVPLSTAAWPGCLWSIRSQGWRSWRGDESLQFPTLNHATEITSGVMEADCRSLLRRFFQEKRKSSNGAGQ